MDQEPAGQQDISIEVSDPYKPLEEGLIMTKVGMIRDVANIQALNEARRVLSRMANTPHVIQTQEEADAMTDSHPYKQWHVGEKYYVLPVGGLQ